VKNDSKQMLGGVGNVVLNLLALGANVSLSCVVGDDKNGKIISDEILKKTGENFGVIVDKNRKTTSKIRFSAGNHKLLRVDYEDTNEIDNEAKNKIISYVNKNIDNINAIVLSDYAKGLISVDLSKELIKISNEKNIPIIIDPKGVDYSKYENAKFLKPNLKELGDALGRKVENTDEDVISGAKQLIEQYNIENVILTRSEKGMTFVNNKGVVDHIPTKAIEVFDVCGAGDSSLAGLSLMIGAGSDVHSAMQIASVISQIVIAKLGTATASVEELLKIIDK
jgi:D-beta-D-heptose 7-phosphate kinase/D-beta-D-heptose 1-phosphate adenosyltransferase